MNVDKAKNILLNKGFGHTEEKITVQNRKITVPPRDMEIQVTLDQLDFYDKNPRCAENEKFEEIKESIREIGLQNKLCVTVRPGGDKYIIKKGGNTRLKALQELYLETKDQKFFTQQVNFECWTSDADLITQHMIENELRGEMIFIDRATATVELKKQIETELGRSLSQRELVEKIKSMGWSISLANLNAYLYATDALLPYIPIAFQYGLGHRSIKALKQQISNIEKWAGEPNHPECQPDIAVKLYLETLHEYDNPELNTDASMEKILYKFGEKISKLVGMDYSLFRIELDAIGNGVTNEELYNGANKAQESKKRVDALSEELSRKAQSQYKTTEYSTSEPKYNSVQQEIHHVPKSANDFQQVDLSNSSNIIQEKILSNINVEQSVIDNAFQQKVDTVHLDTYENRTFGDEPYDTQWLIYNNPPEIFERVIPLSWDVEILSELINRTLIMLQNCDNELHASRLDVYLVPHHTFSVKIKPSNDEINRWETKNPNIGFREHPLPEYIMNFVYLLKREELIHQEFLTFVGKTKIEMDPPDISCLVDIPKFFQEYESTKALLKEDPDFLSKVDIANSIYMTALLSDVSTATKFENINCWTDESKIIYQLSRAFFRITKQMQRLREAIFFNEKQAYITGKNKI